MRKRILSVLLSLCMIVTLLPMAVFATGGYQDYQITEHNLTHVQSALTGVADVTQDGENIVIKLTSHINGCLHIGANNYNDWDGAFILDLNGKTINPGSSNEAICLDNNFEGSLTITGDGTIKTGIYNIIYTWDADIFFSVEDGFDYFSLKIGENSEIYTVTQQYTYRIRGSEIVVNQGRETTETVYAYAYDIQREPDFPATKGEEITVRGFAKPLKYGSEPGNQQTYSSNEGTWTLSEVGTYGEKDSFTPAPNTYLDYIVATVATNYELGTDGKNGLVIHKLTDESDNLVGYGVVIAVDETNGYTLFIADIWNVSGAGYLLSSTEITDSSITLNTEQMAQSTYSVELDQREISFADVQEGYLAPDAKTVKITNTGDVTCGALDISLSGASDSNFTLSKNSIDDIAVSGNDTFTIVPKTGLSAGTYTETLTVKGDKIMPVTATVSFEVTAATAHNNSHTICGDDSCTDTNHAITWTEWTSTTSLPTTSGNYYLGNDVTISSTSYIDGANVNLCLNGHKVDSDDEFDIFSLKDNANLSICDCQTDGTIGGESDPVGFCESNATFNLYSGILVSNTGNTIGKGTGYDGADNTVNIYGGYVKSTTLPAVVSIVGNTVVNLYGGNILATERNGVLVMEASRLNLCGNPVIAGSGLADNTINNAIKTYASNAIDATGYTGDTLTVYYAKDGRQVGDVVIMNVTDETASKFVLSEANAGYMLKREGNNLIYAENPVIPTYTVTFDANGGTVNPATATTETDGKLASLPTPTRSGSYRFNGWFTAASGGTEVTTDTVFSEDTTIYAQWTYKGGSGGGTSYYNVTFNTNGGSKLASQRLRRNAVATEPEEPTKDGFEFEGWYTDKEFKNAYDFATKVTKSITLYAKWVEAKPVHICSSDKFSDLDKTKWYHEDIDYVIENNIMLGTSDTVFAPEENLTRGMLVTILYRSEGEPATNRSIPFADVDMGAYYANAVTWAQQNGIVKGISETEYAPDMNVTREQLATIMLRYAQFKGMDAVTTEENLGFNDASDISDWAVAAMNWGVGRDYIFTRTEGAIVPKVAATRAEIAAFIHRYIVSNEK